MAELKHNVNDESGTQDNSGNEEPQVARKSYTVAEDREIFKNGKTYKAGESVELDEQTARNFAAAGDLQESFDEN